jgi:hypothetical protein
MACWLRFEHQGDIGSGVLHGDGIAVHAGDMFKDPVATGQVLALAAMTVLTLRTTRFNGPSQETRSK